MFISRIYAFLVAFTTSIFFKVSCSSSEFSLDGDYLLGGLFPVHEAEHAAPLFSLEAIECFRQTFSNSGYQMFQVMRFAVEEINNSTTLLPNVSLGYEVFDYCSDAKNFPSVFSFISQNGSISLYEKLNSHQTKVIALTGPYGNTRTINIAPLITMDLIPLVNYGASSYTLSDKLQYPSFIRTIPSNKDLIQMIIHIIRWFKWNWVAFLGDPDSEEGLQLFNNYIRNTGICLAYQEILNQSANYSLTLKKIDKLNINVIVVFTVPQYAKNIIKGAITNNIRDKVWIASETWSMNQQLLKEPGIEKIGTIIGITERFLSLTGFNDFIYKTKETTEVYPNDNTESDIHTKTCNQNCDNCSLVTAEEIINEDPTYSFAIYAAIYTIAHALHKVLHCNMNQCNKNTTVKPYMLLGEIKKLDFSLNNYQVKYDVNGDLTISYAIVVWHTETNFSRIEMVGTYDTYPEINFSMDNSLMPWHNNVPFSNCSVECKDGFSREHVGYHDCCFLCKKCLINSYVNYSRDPYTCFPCADNEWSDGGSATCQTRSVIYLQFTDVPSIALLFSNVCLITLLIITVFIFAYNYNTPVVRSAGGNMSFLMLVCMIISCISAFYFFGEPTLEKCTYRNTIYAFFNAVCLSCFFVRAFQIVCVFKMNEFPNVHRLWVKYNGQWIFVTSFSVFYFFVYVMYIILKPPKPLLDLLSFKNQIFFTCERGEVISISTAAFVNMFLGALCIWFSYMARDLPKNYNEAKSITFSIVFLILVWILYFTVYFFFNSKDILFVNAFVQISSTYGFLFCYFIPKSYIMLFQPKKNTAAYFQTAIQNYTQTISRS
ncbi:taste receptor type 1 member 1-like [Misgurnus anguillicaudatus]|uniref:taste receptor type 1 member 1-like n=1 Tax=Misgurnus anguillicaudatus TaxID=75329 RepID=UPI003CCEFFBE